MALALGLLPTLAGCNEFLDKYPSKGTMKTITDVEQLDALMATYELYHEERNPTFLATDDYGLSPEIQQVKITSTLPEDLDDFTWSGTNNRSATLWNGEYSKIYNANLVLSWLDKVNGSDELKAKVKAEAHLLRAYSNFQLALCYCLYPSAENGAELGLPIKVTASFEESVARKSLAETFRFIESDILEAVKIKKPILNSVTGKNETWRASSAAANALAARFYLYMNNYKEAEKYADAVLAEYRGLRDFNDATQMKYSGYIDTYTINAGTPEAEKVTLMYPHPNDPLNYYYNFFFGIKDLLYARNITNPNNWYIPSKGLLDTFARDIKDGNPQNDLRYLYFICEDYSIRNQCKQISAARYPGYMHIYWDVLVSGPSVAEMMLVKAEVQARAGNAAAAMAQLNKLRKTRIATDAYVDLTATSAADAVKKVIDERRREIPFTMRWYDLKRYNNNDDATDDVTVVHPFYPYTASAVQTGEPVIQHKLEPKSRRWALQIPSTDIVRSSNELVPNRY